MSLFILFIFIIICMIFFFVEKEGFENKNKCAFCIPIYTNHFNYGYRILKELNNVDVDIYFIFTDENEKDTFINFKNLR